MLDDGTILILANYVYTYSLYARTMTFFYCSALTLHLIYSPVPQTQVGTYINNPRGTHFGGLPISNHDRSAVQ